MKLRGTLVALLAGAALTLAFAPFEYYLLALFMPAILLYLWRDVSAKKAAWRGFCFGLAHYLSGTYWVYISLHNYGNAPAVFAALATLLLAVYMALYPALVGYLLARFKPRSQIVHYLLLAPALWVLSEWLRSLPIILNGFPWLVLGYSQTSSPLAGLAAPLGVFAISWALLFSAGLLILLLQTRPRINGLYLLIILSLWLGAWQLRTVNWVEPAGPPLRVSLIQGNVEQKDKWRDGFLEQTLLKYLELSKAAAVDSAVIIWPETAIARFYEDLDPVFIDLLQQHAERSNTDYISGIPFGDLDQLRFYNGVISFGKHIGFYHKRRLLPFGEYLPFRWLFNLFHYFVDIPMADFTAGSEQQALLQAGGHPVGLSICFEAAFGSEIRRSLPQAHYLINLSNDGWFGDSLAPHQHLQIARMRALESQRYMARVTNTGITAFINHHGRITAQAEMFTLTTLSSDIQPLRGVTPYSRFGDTPIIVVLLLLLLTAAYLSVRRTK